MNLLLRRRRLLLEALMNALPDAPGADGVFVRCIWQPEAARRLGTHTFVFRDGGPLAEALRLTGGNAAELAGGMMAGWLRVPRLDWDRHMLITVSAGLKTDVERLVVTRVAVQGKALVVSYRLVRGTDTGGFCYPAETVLVKRFDGEVRFEQEAAPPK